MAWQLHYTSARRGPTGRAGFQFVAETPGLPDGVRAEVTPYLSYRPPPQAPLSPDEGELGRFPVALLYDRVAGRPLLLRCRYLGRDYSGRYGNFFAHAVVAEEEELEGLRPAELWRAPLWADEPLDGGAGADVLPPLEDLSPGAGSDPESLARWLADLDAAASAGPDGPGSLNGSGSLNGGSGSLNGSGSPDGPGSPAGPGAGPYDLLALLMDAVTGVLARGHGRVVLIGADVERIARWIAVVSYSLPVAAATRMSFVTYSADPDGAAQRVVGTTPDVWASAQRHAAHAFHVAGPRTGPVPEPAAGPGGAAGRGAAPARPVRAPSRFARTVAACWRDFDFAGLDALGELAAPGSRTAPEPLDQAATLLSLCRGDRTVTPEEQAAVAGLLARRGAAVPGWVWRDLAEGVPAMGLELALVVHGRARTAGVAQVADGAGAAPGIAAAVASALAAAPDLAEVARIAALAADAGVTVGADEARAAAARCARSGTAELPAALEGAPSGLRETLLDGVLAGLADAGREVRRAVLDGDACDLLYEAPEGLRAVPVVALPVLASVGARHPEHRVAVTGELLRLAGEEPRSAPAVSRALERVWRRPPSATECLTLLEAHADVLAAGGTAAAFLAGLPARAFARLAPGGDDALSAPATLRLAARVRATLPEGESSRAAAVVQAYADAVTAERAGQAAEAFAVITGPEAPARLSDAVLAAAAQRLARRGPRFRAALLEAVPGPLRSRLGELWTAGLAGRARSGRAPVRAAETAQRNELVEVVLRLRRRGVTEPALETWARSAAGRWLSARQLDAHFAGDRELRAALRELVAEARGRGE
ncbi:hypothetical protein GCM10023085_00160 [Actinomadura viridis]|uniref:Uncharacterized protein n=1 Tax=Actinomadura viridis TaxID=58110 RepID=A0A931DNI7_9ACTN|nr:hypothetical protein [Actinomadura viridis]MBG6090836.1 hypothetical protein [Actinomadura viridis]